MRRIASALALLLSLALPAQAGKLLVLQRDADGTTSADVARTRQWLDAHGVDYTWIPASASKTLWLLNGTHSGPTGTVQYVAAWVFGYKKGSFSTVGAQPESLYRAPGGTSRWPAIPIALIADFQMNSASMFGAPGIDTTGFGGNGGQSVPTTGTRLEWSPLTGRGWSNFGLSQGISLLPGPGYNRNILLSRLSTVNAYNALSPKTIGAAGINGWPSRSRDSVGAATDSGNVVARYSLKANGDPDMSRPVIAVSGTSGTFASMVRRMEIALAMCDSAAGRTILFQTRPGPVRMSINVDAVGATGNYDAQDTGQNGASVGIYSPGQSAQDSVETQWRAVCDTAGYYGVEMTMGVQLNPDSAANRWQVDYARDRCKTCLFYPYERAGLGDYDGFGGADAAGGANDAAHNYDPWGAQRLRSLLPPGETDPRDGCNCTTSGPNGGPDTASVYCNVSRLRAQLSAYVGDSRVARVWGCPLNDFTSSYFGRSGGSIDSLVWICSLLGIGGLRVGIMQNSNNSSSDGGSGLPRGWMRTLTLWPIKDPATGKLLGQFAFLPGRQSDTQCDIANWTGHDLGSEFLAGWLSGGSWFEGFDSRPIYSSGHEFLTRLCILTFSASYMTGAGDSRYVWRPGYRWLMDYVLWMDTVNRYAGRTVIEIGSGQKVANWIVRTGLR